MDEPKRLWWRKKRWIAVAVIATVLSYPLSFWPACWFALRLDIERSGDELIFFTRLYDPVLDAIAESPRPVRHFIFWTLELGAPRDGKFLRNRDHVVVWVNQEYGITLRTYP